MEQGNPELPRQPDIDVPEPSMRLPKEELELLIPEAQSPEEPIFREVRSRFIQEAGKVAVKPRARRQPAKKRPGTTK